MALKANITATYLGKAIVFDGAYARIHQVEANKPIKPSEVQPQPPAASRASVMFYTDAECTQQIKVHHYAFDLDFSPAAKNPWEQAYAYLKSLPEFAGAVDC